MVVYYCLANLNAEYYCYNVEALLLLFWYVTHLIQVSCSYVVVTDFRLQRAINLGKRMWHIRGGRHKYDDILWPSVLAKLSAVIIPGILMGVIQLDYMLEHRTLMVIVGNVCCM